MKKNVYLIIVLLAVGSLFFSFAVRADEIVIPTEATQTFKFDIRLPEPDLPSIATQSEIIGFPWGAAMGKVRKQTETGKDIIIISGPTGMALKKDHDHGILLLTFATQTTFQPVTATFAESPHSLLPHVAVLDGRPVEVEIAAEQSYLYMNPVENKEIKLSNIAFINKELSSSATDESIIIISLQTNKLDVIKSIFGK